jgi:hypothetical protein
VNDLAIITAIIYAGRLQRRLPENAAQKLATMQESCADAKLILAAVAESSPLSSPTALPEQPQSPPSGVIGRNADVKASRRRA